MRLNKLVGSVWLLGFVFLCVTGEQVNAAAVVQQDGSISLSHVKVGGQFYRARLDLSTSSSSSLLPTLELTEVAQTDTDGSEDGYYIAGTRTLTIPNLRINNVAYTLSFRLNAFNQFVLEQIQLRDEISLLYLITSGGATFAEQGQYFGEEIGPHFTIPADSNIVLFSDRPHRIARSFSGGLVSFENFYANSDFLDDPPNVTFSGRSADIDRATVFEMRAPFVFQDTFVVPVIQAVGEESLPPYGSYTDVSFVVDNWFTSAVSSVASDVESTADDVASAVGDAVDHVENGVTSLWNSAKGYLLRGLSDVESLMSKLVVTDAMSSEADDAVNKHADVFVALQSHASDFEGLSSAIHQQDADQVWQVVGPILADEQVNSAFQALGADLSNYSLVIDVQESLQDVVGETAACGIALSLASAEIFVDPDSVTPDASFYCSAGGSLGFQLGGNVGVAVGIAFSPPENQHGGFAGIKASATVGLGTGVSVTWPISSEALESFGTHIGRITVPFTVGADLRIALAGGYRWLLTSTN